MKAPTTVPLICGAALTAMIAAGASHWWSVRQFIVAMDGRLPASIVPRSAPADSTAQPQAIAKTVNAQPRGTFVSASQQEPHQKEFYEALIAKMASMETQNRDLLDQLAETNRDLMKLEFRVDTHSESFRPLPVSEDQPFSSLADDLGVLPPRAEPVFLPTHE